jgi:hypothetical protein
MGQELALGNKLPIRTETTDNNLGFYQKLGFSKKGDWEIQFPDISTSIMLSVLEWTHNSSA